MPPPHTPWKWGDKHREDRGPIMRLSNTTCMQRHTKPAQETHVVIRRCNVMLPPSFFVRRSWKSADHHTRKSNKNRGVRGAEAPKQFSTPNTNAITHNRCVWSMHPRWHRAHASVSQNDNTTKLWALHLPPLVSHPRANIDHGHALTMI